MQPCALFFEENLPSITTQKEGRVDVFAAIMGTASRTTRLECVMSLLSVMNIMRQSPGCAQLEEGSWGEY